MLLSLIINIFMLITWHAKKSLADVQDDQELPDDLFKSVLCFIARSITARLTIHRRIYRELGASKILQFMLYR